MCMMNSIIKLLFLPVSLRMACLIVWLLRLSTGLSMSESSANPPFGKRAFMLSMLKLPWMNCFFRCTGSFSPNWASYLMRDWFIWLWSTSNNWIITDLNLSGLFATGRFNFSLRADNHKYMHLTEEAQHFPRAEQTS